jgi:hypothetical protein
MTRISGKDSQALHSSFFYPDQLHQTPVHKFYALPYKTALCMTKEHFKETLESDF